MSFNLSKAYLIKLVNLLTFWFGLSTFLLFELILNNPNFVKQFRLVHIVARRGSLMLIRSYRWCYFLFFFIRQFLFWPCFFKKNHCVLFYSKVFKSEIIFKQFDLRLRALTIPFPYSFKVNYCLDCSTLSLENILFFSSKSVKFLETIILTFSDCP